MAAKGQGVDMSTLKSAVGGLDLAKLKGMKEVGCRSSAPSFFGGGPDSGEFSSPGVTYAGC